MPDADGDQSGLLELDMWTETDARIPFATLSKHDPEVGGKYAANLTEKTIYQRMAAADGLSLHRTAQLNSVLISAYVFDRASAIDAVVIKVRESIDTLTEYRAALVTSAVTGQIAELQ